MQNSQVENFSFNDEDNLAQACSRTLRKVKSLSELAPIGRLFSAISTLTETSQNVQAALAHGDLTKATEQLNSYAVDRMEPAQTNLASTLMKRKIQG